jgi:hypothetical protein
VRDLSQYSLFLWSNNIGKYHEANSIQIDKAQKSDAIEKIKNYNQKKGTYKSHYVHDDIHDRNIERPVIFCEANRWVMQPMYRLIDFMNLFK